MNPEPSSQSFRAGVGAVIVNDERQVLALERKDVPGAWQLPQGGIDRGETPEQSVVREIREETGIGREQLKPITQETRLLSYELPDEHRTEKTGRGQTLYWYLFLYTGDAGGIDLKQSEEFRDWKWMSMEELVSEVVEFRKPVYRELETFLNEQLPVK